MDLVSDRIVANQYAKIYDNPVVGTHCFKYVTEDDVFENPLNKAVEDAIRKQPGADALIKVELRGARDKKVFCMKAVGIPVRLK